MPAQYHVTANHVLELDFQTALPHPDPFNELEVDALILNPDGSQSRLPAFWSGGADWRLRFSAPAAGVYPFRLTCAAGSDPGLEGQAGTITVHPLASAEANLLYLHGAPQVDSGRRAFAYADGTPFFWLGDTWWMAFCGRLGWPEDFQALAADRKAKGFSVIHLVAGLFPDVPPQDRRGWNAGGSAWEEGFTRVNPAFFDQADLKLQYLVSQGMVPLVVGAWGYYLPVLGLAKMKQHWRYLVARWGAYPLFWCLAGEVSMPYYLTQNREADALFQREGWSQVGAYLRDIDPFHRPITAHSGAMSESPAELSDPACLDFNFVQTGHGNHAVALQAARHIQRVAASTALRPVVNAETCYEGILGTAWQDVQRFCFWSSFLSGSPAYSYGANGIWQVNCPGAPFGPSPHGMSWGDAPWTEVMRLPGSQQLGYARALLETLPWQRFEPHPEWVEPHAAEPDWFRPYAAGVPGEVLVVYFPSPLAPWAGRPQLRGLAHGAA